MVNLILTSLDELRQISICFPARRVGIGVDVVVNNRNYLQNPPLYLPPHQPRHISIQQLEVTYSYIAVPIMDVQMIEV